MIVVGGEPWPEFAELFEPFVAEVGLEMTAPDSYEEITALLFMLDFVFAEPRIGDAVLLAIVADPEP